MVVVCFVDIDGIVDHHSLNFLFIIRYLKFYEISLRHCKISSNVIEFRYLILKIKLRYTKNICNFFQISYLKY
jgi:hypothetical protein